MNALARPINLMRISYSSDWLCLLNDTANLNAKCLQNVHSKFLLMINNWITRGYSNWFEFIAILTFFPPHSIRFSNEFQRIYEILYAPQVEHGGKTSKVFFTWHFMRQYKRKIVWSRVLTWIIKVESIMKFINLIR